MIQTRRESPELDGGRYAPRSDARYELRGLVVSARRAQARRSFSNPASAMTRYAILLAALVGTLGCSTLTDVDAPAQLVGTWQSPLAALSPAGAMQTTLRFGADGEFVADVRSYGLYPGQTAGELSAYSHVTGTYATAGDALLIEPTELAWWDRFYGPESPEQVVAPYPYGDIYDQATYQVRGEVLTLQYITYPADAPEPTTAIFRRVR
jgi:hypothetical protein